MQCGRSVIIVLAYLFIKGMLIVVVEFITDYSVIFLSSSVIFAALS